MKQGSAPSEPGYRNILVFAHIDAGKTSLVERLLLEAGAVDSFGPVEEGASTTDTLREEQRRGITIRTGAASLRWRDRRLHLLDTPGHLDFGADVERLAAVANAALLVVCGVRGVQPRTRELWPLVRLHRLPVLAWVNKLDDPRADLGKVLLGLEEELDTRPLPLICSWEENGAPVGWIDLVSERAGRFGDSIALEEPPMSPLRSTLETVMWDGLSLLDDEVFRHLFSGSRPPPAALRSALQASVADPGWLPVWGGSARRGGGHRSLLNALAELTPPPDPTGKARVLDLVRRFQAVGGSANLALARPCGGGVCPGQVYEGRAGDVMVEAIWHPCGERLDPAHALEEGEMGVVTLRGTWSPGEHLGGGPRTLMSRDEPVLELVLETLDPSDDTALGLALAARVEDDPSLRAERELETGRWLLRGRGELHLEVAAHLVEESSGIAFRTGRPHVRVRERLRRPAIGLIDTLVAEGQTLMLEADLLPTDREVPSVEWREPLFPEPVRLAVEDGILQATRSGRHGAGLTHVNWILRLTTTDHAVPPVLAKRLVDRAAPVWLRSADIAREVPRARAMVVVAAEHLGAVQREFQTRQARIENLLAGPDGREWTVIANSPLEKLLGLATLLRSLSGGGAELAIFPDGWTDASATAETPTRKALFTRTPQA